MDNRLNRIRKAMNVLRGEMLREGAIVRGQVDQDRDCTEAALRLLAMRAEMRALVEEWTRFGGFAHLPTVEERLKEQRGPIRSRPRYARAPGYVSRRRAARF